MPMEDGVNVKPLNTEGLMGDALCFDAVGYLVDDPTKGLDGVTNDRRVNNPVRRDKPYGR